MSKKFKNPLLQLVPLAVLMLILCAALYFRVFDYLSFDTLKQHRAFLLQWTHQNYSYAVLGFMVIYIVAVAISIPGAVFLTLAGGFLFGVVWGTVYVVISATLGGAILFLAVKTAARPWIENRTSGWVKKMEKGFRENAFNYLLTLRLIPLFPFWLVNIVPAILNIPLRIFITATLIGIIPGSVIYVSVGNGLGHLFDSGQKPDLNIIFTPPILLPLLGLSILSLIPILYKFTKRKDCEK